MILEDKYGHLILFDAIIIKEGGFVKASLCYFSTNLSPRLQIQHRDSKEIVGKYQLPKEIVKQRQRGKALNVVLEKVNE